MKTDNREKNFKKLLQRCIFYLTAKDPGHNNRLKVQQKLLFKFW